MKTTVQPRLLPILAVAVLALLGLAAPTSAQAQEAVAVQQPAAAPLAVPQVSEEKLAAYASAYTEIADVRERINAEFARTGNKIKEAQDELRKQRQEEVKQIIEAKGLTLQEYERITWALSVDSKQMEAFQQILAKQRATGGSQSQQ